MQRHCFCSLLSLFFYTLALSLFFQFVEFAHVTIETDQTNQCGQSRQKRGGGSVERIDHHFPHIGVYIVQHQLQQQWQVGFVNSSNCSSSSLLIVPFLNSYSCTIVILTFLHLTTTTSLASHMFFLSPERCCCRRKKTAAEPLGTECWNCCCCSPLAASKVGQGEAAFAATGKRNTRVHDICLYCTG